MIEQFYRKMLLASTYPLSLALMGGAVWVDRIYAHAMAHAGISAGMAAPRAQVADRLLLLSLVVIATGVLCAGLLHGVARRLVIASLVVFCLELLLPVLAPALPGGTIYFAMLGPGLRVAILLAALMLALLAMRRALS